MILPEDLARVKQAFHLSSLRPGEAHITNDGSDERFILDYYWLARFNLYAGRFWYGLIVCILKRRDGYYGLLSIAEDPERPNYDDYKTEPLKLDNWDDTVSTSLHNLNVLMVEFPVLNENIKYSFLVSSNCLTTELTVNSSYENIKSQPSFRELTLNIAMTVEKLAHLYNREKITELIFAEWEQYDS